MGQSTALRRRIDDPGIAHRELRTLSAHPSRGVGFTRLPVAEQVGGQDDNQKKDLGKVTLPIHLKLVQAGGQTQLFTSTDGRAWGEPRMILPTTFDAQSRVGLFVCSGNTFASTTATFDSVQASP